MSEAPLEVRLVKPNPWLTLVLVICSFGLVLPLWGLALLFDQRPRRIDEFGITTVRNRRYLWSKLEEAKPHLEYRRTPAGQQVLINASLRLRFSNGTLTILPAVLLNGREVIERIERKLGRTFELPR